MTNPPVMDEATVTIMVVCVAQMTRLRTSRPLMSVPNGCCRDGEKSARADASEQTGQRKEGEQSPEERLEPKRPQGAIDRERHGVVGKDAGQTDWRTERQAAQQGLPSSGIGKIIE